MLETEKTKQEAERSISQQQQKKHQNTTKRRMKIQNKSLEI